MNDGKNTVNAGATNVAAEPQTDNEQPLLTGAALQKEASYYLSLTHVVQIKSYELTQHLGKTLAERVAEHHRLLRREERFNKLAEQSAKIAGAIVLAGLILTPVFYLAPKDRQPAYLRSRSGTERLPEAERLRERVPV